MLRRTSAELKGVDKEQMLVWRFREEKLMKFT